MSSLDDVDAESLKQAAERLLGLLGEAGAVVLGSPAEGKVSIVVAFSPAVRGWRWRGGGGWGVGERGGGSKWWVGVSGGAGGGRGVASGEVRWEDCTSVWGGGRGAAKLGTSGWEAPRETTWSLRASKERPSRRIEQVGLMLCIKLLYITLLIWDGIYYVSKLTV